MIIVGEAWLDCNFWKILNVFELVQELLTNLEGVFNEDFKGFVFWILEIKGIQFRFGGIEFEL